MKLSPYRSLFAPTRDRPKNLARAKYPDWVQALQGKSGVYVFRGIVSGRILYIGESHTGRLKKTMLRHFQNWKGQTAGPTYTRILVEVAVCIERKDRAQARQDELIRRLSPIDNFDDEVPF